MIFEETKLAGVFVITIDPNCDERGHFARTFSRTEFAKRGLCADWPEMSTSYNHVRGTLRGLHYQAAPYEEIKLIRCTRGAIYDVAVDLRPDSQTYRQWVAVEMTEDNGKSFYLPKGIAHGFQTLRDRSEVFYQISTPYFAESSRGWRWNDPAFGVGWPEVEPRVISARDQGFRDFA